jgi:hypothetical protein
MAEATFFPEVVCKEAELIQYLVVINTGNGWADPPACDKSPAAIASR